MITGSIVALVTPMHADGSVDWASLERLLDLHVAAGTAAIGAVGTTGESATLSVPEHCEVIKHCVQYIAGRIPIVAVLPNDTQLIYGAPSVRRKFMDALISQYDAAYLKHLIAYAHALDQRNALLAQFGSIAGVLGAPERELVQITRIGTKAARDIKVVAALASRSLRAEIEARPVLSSWSAVINYCTSAMAHEKIEQFRILFLNKKNHLIADEVQQSGTIDHTPVYPREVIKRALELSASAIILVHNHPTGDPTPSRADIDMTKTIIESAAPMGIVIHDHIIIGKQGHASMKGLQLI